jgi:hypothetical protein
MSSSGDKCPKCQQGWLHVRTSKDAWEPGFTIQYIRCTQSGCDFETKAKVAAERIRRRSKRSGNLPPTSLAIGFIPATIQVTT